MEFIGRRRELEMLERYYSSDAVRTCAIVGRRRVGKTSLIREFCKGKPSLTINLVGREPEKVLDHVARDISECTGEDRGIIRAGIRDLDGLMDYLGGLRPTERMVVALDEFPDAVETFPDAAATVMRYVDGRLREQNILLIVCGSSISAMMRELNDGSRPLFQRFPVQLHLRPLPYAEARLFHPGLPEEDRIRMYAIASGVPLYHQMMSMYGSPEDAVKGLFLGRVPPLYLEARSALLLEVSPYATYDRVLAAIGDGAGDVKTLAERAGLSKTRCSEILTDLRVLDTVGVDSSYGSRGKTIRYRICDGFLDFYYSVLSGNESVLDRDPDDAFESLRERTDTFYGRRFEDVCSEFVRSTERCLWCGRWWGRVPVVGDDGTPERGDDGRVIAEDTDVDIMATVSRGDARFTMAGECKFIRRKAGVRELRNLMRRADRALKGGENVEYVLFSRSGFTDELREVAEDSRDVRVRLVSMDDLRGWAESMDVRSRPRIGGEPSRPSAVPGGACGPTGEGI